MPSRRRATLRWPRSEKRCWKTPSGAEKSAWVVSYSLAGKRHIKTFTLKKAAETWRAQTLTKIVHGTHAPVSTSITVAKAAELWLEQCRADGLERATQEQYEQHIRLHIKAGTRRFDPDQGRADVVSFVVLALAAGDRARLVAHDIARGEAGGLGVRQDSAQRCHDLNDRRAAFRAPPAGERSAEPGHASGCEFRYPDMAEQRIGHWRPLIVTLVFTGLRASELRGLRWPDVNLAGGALHVRQRADRYQEIGKPKSAAGHRSIPLPPLVVTVLKEWWLACPKGPIGLVFPNKVGGVEVLHAITAAVKACQIKAGLRGEGRKPRYGLHSFRHACISLWIDQGFSPKRVQVWAGHSSIGITFGVYGHLFPDPEGDQAAMAHLQQALLG